MSNPFDLDLTDVQVHIKPVGAIRKLLKSMDDGSDDYILEIDWSSLESFLSCKRSTLWKLIYSRSTYQTPALTYGSAIHSALEVYYRHMTLFPGDEPPLDQMFMAGEAHFLQAPPPVGEWRDYNQFTVNIQKYLKEEKLKPLYPLKLSGSPAVELPFAFPLGEITLNTLCPFDKSLVVLDSPDDKPFHINKVQIVWTGIIDLITSANEQIWITDHKTSSVAGDSLFKGFELSQQFRGYQWATEKLLGRPITGAIANVLAGRKPTKTGVSFELLRRYYPYPRHRIEEWPHNILLLVGDLLHSLTSNSFPEETQWCINKFGMCPFFDVCAEAPEDRMMLLHSDLYCDNVWNPIDQ